MGNFGRNTRFVTNLFQGLIRLFGAGAILFEAHNLFLRYYAREWGGIQFAGVNGCQGEDRIANGDLFEGQTFCNQPINFVPWVEMYRRHWQAAAIYYALALTFILAASLTLTFFQKKLASPTPFGGPAKAVSPAESEHLR